MNLFYIEWIVTHNCIIEDHHRNPFDIKHVHILVPGNYFSKQTCVLGSFKAVTQNEKNRSDWDSNILLPNSEYIIVTTTLSHHTVVFVHPFIVQVAFEACLHTVHTVCPFTCLSYPPSTRPSHGWDYLSLYLHIDFLSACPSTRLPAYPPVRLHAYPPTCQPISPIDAHLTACLITIHRWYLFETVIGKLQNGKVGNGKLGNGHLGNGILGYQKFLKQ